MEALELVLMTCILLAFAVWQFFVDREIRNLRNIISNSMNIDREIDDINDAQMRIMNNRIDRLEGKGK